MPLTAIRFKIQGGGMPQTLSCNFPKATMVAFSGMLRVLSAQGTVGAILSIKTATGGPQQGIGGPDLVVLVA